jgi:hypothetical protein
MKMGHETEIVNGGLRLECGLQSLLFNLYIHIVLEEWKRIKPKVTTSLRNNIYSNSILYVNDQVFLADNEDDLVQK